MQVTQVAGTTGKRGAKGPNSLVNRHALPVASPTGWISFAGAPREASTHLRSSALGGMTQSMHAVAPVLLYFPAGQKLQSSVLFPALYFPASHAVHWPALALA